jgi:cytoplasmic iron level regulating protein YaaA (DUF328/UPF0246 family)
MDISDPLSVLNVTRYADWHPDHADARQAVMSFDGDVYTGLGARSLTPKRAGYVQDRVRILSGLYGLLRPLDRCIPTAWRWARAWPTRAARTCMPSGARP